jgi:hypothetical protein
MMYETHITIEPIMEDARREEIAQLIAPHGFKLAELVMMKKDSMLRSQLDTFMTGHDCSYAMSTIKLTMCVSDIQKAGIKVLRYKIEQIMLDSKYQDDPLKLLTHSTT